MEAGGSPCCITVSPHCLTELVTPGLAGPGSLPARRLRSALVLLPAANSQNCQELQHTTMGHCHTVTLAHCHTGSFHQDWCRLTEFPSGSLVIWQEDVRLSQGFVRGLSWPGARWGHTTPVHHYVTLQHCQHHFNIANLYKAQSCWLISWYDLLGFSTYFFQLLTVYLKGIVWGTDFSLNVSRSVGKFSRLFLSRYM